MNGINKVILIGNTGGVPEIREIGNGAGYVANVTLATSDSWKDKNTGEKVERTEWHKLSFFGKLAEIVGRYVKKGTKIYVEGKLQTKKWQDKDGNERYTTSIVCHEMQILSPRTSQDSNAAQTTPTKDDFDDDIPF